MDKEKAVIPSASEKNLLDEASALRNKAHALSSESRHFTPSSGVPGAGAASETDEGVMMPRGDETFAIPRVKGYESTRDNIPASQDAQPNGNDPMSADKQDARMQLDKNRLKANQYINGKAPPNVAFSNNDSVVECKSTGNVSGRIGDDSMSGKEIIIIRDHKQVTVHCK